MIRLTHKNDLNSPDEYDRIFKLRAKKDVDYFDRRRWNKLLKYWRGGRLLDIGCLDSLIGEIAESKNSGAFPFTEVWGIDVAKEAIEAMQARYPYYQYMQMDLYKMRFPDDMFDYVVMGEVIEHLEDPKGAIKEAMRVLKPGGILALSTPMDEIKEPGAVDGDRHLWSFSESDMYELLDPYGYVKVKVLGSTYIPYRYCWPQLLAFCKKYED